ncbi:sigma-70 family RNA polymerase sigma factor [Bacteroides oleiciplenus]|uniref:Sigma-70 family RNA polymerase sigma factor n=1 Tax=Bacteroides oleiciplenus YIT 12058 TaxID=742727 RepID=K9DWU6_9BACE|nr:sigma-70 family RNA polymerase sigma factor [Bacteroides oleiciplenus]EKU89439.1 sigma-70 family RNA polymerase sigma factor [Bacteroides oleiciplenus YIT 12058]
MKDITMTSTQIVTDSYTSYRRSVYLYIYYKINSKEEAEDLVQDVFLRLMDYKKMLRPDTVKFFIHTIARNLVTDYLRRHYKRQEITSYMYDHAVIYTNEAESQIIANDLLSLEKHKLQMLSDQRRKVYVMNRFQEQSVSEISMKLNLSQRTVENHLFVSRKLVRDFIKQCI